MTTLSPHLFGVFFLGVLLSMTASSYLIHKHNLIEKLLTFKIANISAKYFLYANTFAGILCMGYDPMLGILLLYVSTMLLLVVKAGGMFPWAISLVKIGYLFSAVYYVISSFLKLSLAEKVLHIM